MDFHATAISLATCLAFQGTRCVPYIDDVDTDHSRVGYAPRTAAVNSHDPKCRDNGEQDNGSFCQLLQVVGGCPREPARPEEVLSRYAPEERLRGLPPEERLRGLSPEELQQLEAYLKTRH